jgi:ribosomal protein S18 acetylase RimI-like enzyme
MPPSESDSDQPRVRRASPGDGPQVARLLHDFQQEFDEPSPGVEPLSERYRELIRKKEMTVLLVGDGPDGFAQLRYRPTVYSPGLAAYLEELYVVPELRRRGLGRTLLDTTMDTARAEGADYMEIGVDESDGPARALYESAGFTNRESGGPGVMFYYEREL